MSAPVFRFAPSPNGYLHLGHALSALLNAELARAAGGRLLLRIEDIDARAAGRNTSRRSTRISPGSGIAWEKPVRRQTEHFDDYRAALGRLDALGLIYPSFESRGEIARLVAERERNGSWPRDPDGAPLYPGDARSLSRRERRRAHAGGRALCAAARHGGGLARVGALTWTRERGGPGRRDRRRRGRARGLGRRGAGAQGRADQLSSLGRGRRCAARRDPCRARAGSVLGDQRPPAAAGPARPAGAAPIGITA